MECPTAGVELIAVQEVEPVEPVVDRANDSDAGGWMLLGIVLALLVFELWALHTGRPTISVWVARKTRGQRWWKAFGLVSIGLILWHLFGLSS